MEILKLTFHDTPLKSRVQEIVNLWRASSMGMFDNFERNSMWQLENPDTGCQGCLVLVVLLKIAMFATLLFRLTSVTTIFLLLVAICGKLLTQVKIGVSLGQGVKMQQQEKLISFNVRKLSSVPTGWRMLCYFSFQ